MTKTYSQYMHPSHYIDKKYRTKGAPCGYCHCDRHKGYLNVTLMKSHKCLAKKCPFFEKYTNHSCWNQSKTVLCYAKTK